jgi:hypothetical protein
VSGSCGTERRLFGWFIGTTARYQALEAISIAAPDELIRGAITVRKRFTGLGEAEDYQTAAAAFGRSVPPVARNRRPRRKARKSRRPHKNLSAATNRRLGLISPVLRALLTCGSKVRN